MSTFTDNPSLQAVGDGKHWRVQTPFAYLFGSGASEVRIDIPAGFVTDLASVPRLFWNILPPFGVYENAAIVHDWCYANQRYSKSFSDAVLLEGMEVLNVPKWKREVIYQGVHLFGQSSWNEDTKKFAKFRSGEIPWTADAALQCQ